MKNTKVFLIMIAFVSLINKVHGQDVESLPIGDDYYKESGVTNSCLSLNAGLAVPTNRYSANYGTSYRGNAELGSALNLAAYLPFNQSNWGASVMFGNYSNPFNVNKYAAGIQAADEGTSSTTVIQNEYEVSTVMVGLCYAIPIKRFSIDLRALGGIAFSDFPEVSYSVNQYNSGTSSINTYNWNIASSESFAGAYDIGAGLRYNFKRVRIMTNIDYLVCKPYFSSTEQYTDQVGNKSYSSLSGTIPISILSFTAGVGYQINY